MINNMSRKDWHDLVVPVVEALERIASAVEGIDARYGQSALDLDVHLDRIATALEAQEPKKLGVQALNETSRALENSRGGTQL